MKKILILLGPTRTSTTSIFRYLSKFEDFSPSSIKETNFFLDSKLDKMSFEEVIESYDQLFKVKDNSKILLEASPLYFMKPKEVAGRIDRLIKNGYEVKLLITLRDPVERFLSLYKHIITKRSIGKYNSFDNFLENNLKFVNSGDSENLDFNSLFESNYSLILEEWLKAFPPNTLKIVYFEDIISDNISFDKVLKAIYKWISNKELNDNISFIHENESKQVKFKNIHSFIMWLNNCFEPILNRLPKLRKALKNLYYAFNSSNKDSYSISDKQKTLIESAFSKNNICLKDKIIANSIFCNLPKWINKID